MKLTLNIPPEIAAQVRRGFLDPLEVAAQKSIEQVGDLAKQRARASIAAGGFSKRWENALRLKTYPSGGRRSLTAAAWLYHQIPYADVFESGAAIRGKPMLWLPLSNTPKKIGGKAATPKNYPGDLFSVNRPGKRPLLFGYPVGGTVGKKRGKGAPAKGQRAVPLFVGIDVVTLRKRFNILDSIEQAAGELPGIFDQNLKAD